MRGSEQALKLTEVPATSGWLKNAFVEDQP